MVEAQNAQPIAHPTWLETQTVVPCSYRISTASTAFPSCSRSRYFAVPSSAETCFSDEKIECVYDTVVDEICGSDKVEKVIVTNKKTSAKSEIALDGVFIAVGITPNLNNIEGLPSQDEGGYIIADETCESSIPGIYAAGDVRTKQLRQVITAAADGANAITSVERYLNNL